MCCEWFDIIIFTLAHIGGKVLFLGIYNTAGKDREFHVEWGALSYEHAAGCGAFMSLGKNLD